MIEGKIGSATERPSLRRKHGKRVGQEQESNEWAMVGDGGWMWLVGVQDPVWGNRQRFRILDGMDE